MKINKINIVISSTYKALFIVFELGYDDFSVNQNLLLHNDQCQPIVFDLDRIYHFKDGEFLLLVTANIDIDPTRLFCFGLDSLMLVFNYELQNRL